MDIEFIDAIEQIGAAADKDIATLKARIEALESQLKNIRNVYDSIDLNACVMAPRKLFDLTDAIYADNKGKDQ